MAEEDTKFYPFVIQPSMSDADVQDVKDVITTDFEPTFAWNESQCKILQSHHAYHWEMMLFTEELMKHGPAGKQLPQAPTGSLKTLLQHVTSQKTF